MSLGDFASIAIIIQGIFFVVSICLVWYQLRENTNLVRIANSQKLVEMTTPFNLQLAQDRGLAELWLKGSQEIDDLDEVDRERYFNLLTWWLNLHENIYHQWRKKLIEKDTYMSWALDLEYYTKRQNLKRHWPGMGVYFEQSFTNYVTEMLARQAEAEK